MLRSRNVFAPARRNLLFAVLALLLPGTVAIPAAQARHRKPHLPGGTLPYMGPQPAPSIFGADTSLYDSNHSYFVRDVPVARGLGARWDHFTIGPATGTGNFGPLDWQVRQARQYGMGVILSFAGIARACPRMTSNPQACPPTTGSGLRVYQSYVRQVVLRYRNVVSYYESWVEPNNRAQWQPRADAAAYAGLLEAEYAVFRSVNRRYGLHLKLLFGSPIGFSTKPRTGIAVLPFVDHALDDLHGQRVFDGIALHAYRFPPGRDGPSRPACDYVKGARVALGYSTPACPSPRWRYLTWPQELEAYEQQFEAHGYGQQPLWLTEFGWPGSTHARGGYFPGDATQARYLIEAYTDLLQLPFVQAAFWFNIRDYQPGLSSPDPSFFYHYGLLNYGLTPKPAALAFRLLALVNPGR